MKTSAAATTTLVVCLWTTLLSSVTGFVVVSRPSSLLSSPVVSKRIHETSLQMMDMASLSSAGIVLAETEPWVQPLANVLDPTLNLMSFAMLCRVVLSWYPSTPLNKFPYIFVTWPTQPLLLAVRGLIPPAFGVDITPIFWLAIFTFFHEILLGQQGLLIMKIKYGI